MIVTSLPLLQPNPQSEYFPSLGEHFYFSLLWVPPTTAVLPPLLDYFPQGQMPSSVRHKSNRTNPYFCPAPHISQDKEHGESCLSNSQKHTETEEKLK